MTDIRQRTITGTIQIIKERLEANGHALTPYDLDLIRWGLAQTYETGELEGEVRAGLRHQTRHQTPDALLGVDTIIAQAGPLDRKDYH